MLKSKGIIDLRNNRIRKHFNFNQFLNNCVLKVLLDPLVTNEDDTGLKGLQLTSLKLNVLELQQERDKIQAQLIINVNQLRELKNMKPILEEDIYGI